MYRWCFYGLSAITLSLTACSSHPLNEHPITNQSTKTQVSQNQITQPTGMLTLKQSLALAMDHTPALQAGRLQIQAHEARINHSGIRPDPELEIEFENFAGSGDFQGIDALETTISLAQSFPLGGDLKYMKLIAGKESELATWDQQALRVELLSTVTQRYLQALTLQQRLKKSNQSLQLATQVQTLTDKRIKAGVAPPLERIRADVQVAQAKLDHQKVQRQLTASYQQLALTWGQSQVTFDNVSGELETIADLPRITDLFDQTIKHPLVARWASELSLRQAQHQLANAIAVNDLTGRIGFKHDNDANDHALVIGLSMPLPISDRNMADRLSSRIGMQAVTHQKRQAELHLRQTLVDAYTQLAIAHDVAIALREDALPKAQQAFDVTRQAFEQGDVQFIDVIDAEQTLNKMHSQHLDALANYHLASAWIEGLICQPLNQITKP